MAARDPDNPLREQELREWREREIKDLEVEADTGPRPLEGLSQAPGSLWPEDTDERAAEEEHGDDEIDSERASVQQIPPDPDRNP